MGAKQPAKLGRYLTALRPSRSFIRVRRSPVSGRGPLRWALHL